MSDNNNPEFISPFTSDDKIKIYHNRIERDLSLYLSRFNETVQKVYTAEEIGLMIQAFRNNFKKYTKIVEGKTVVVYDFYKYFDPFMDIFKLFEFNSNGILDFYRKIDLVYKDTILYNRFKKDYPVISDIQVWLLAGVYPLDTYVQKQYLNE